MDKLLIILNNFFTQAKVLLYEVYNKLLFLFNKQMTLQKIYKPMTESKAEVNKELFNELSALKEENKLLMKNAEELMKENNLLKSKISNLQLLLLKK